MVMLTQFLKPVGSSLISSLLQARKYAHSLIRISYLQSYVIGCLILNQLWSCPMIIPGRQCSMLLLKLMPTLNIEIYDTSGILNCTVVRSLYLLHNLLTIINPNSNNRWQILPIQFLTNIESTTCPFFQTFPFLLCFGCNLSFFLWFFDLIANVLSNSLYSSC